MTAEIVELHPTGGHADDTIRRTIDALIKGKGLSPDAVASAAHMSRSTFFYKMGGHGADRAFKAGEVAEIARFLGVSVGQLYDGLGGTFIPPQPPGGEGLSARRARRDSNSQPSDPKVVVLRAAA